MEAAIQEQVTKTAKSRNFVEPRYQFRGPQADLLRSAEREIVLSGPAGTGKSVACLYKLHKAALKYPGSRSLMLRKTRASLTDSGLVTFEQRILGDGNPICAGALRENRHSYKYPNGSEIVVGGMDQSTRLFSTDYDRVYVQECTELSLSEWESLLRSLRNGKTLAHQLMGDCNPDAPRHWLYLRSQQGGCTMWHTRHEDNPRLHDGADWTSFGNDYLSTLDRFTGIRYKRMRLGLWAAAEGTVYEFDRAVHLVDSFAVPADWRKFRSIDFGYTNPFVCQWWTVDPDGRAYLYREIYRTKRLVQDHAADITRLSGNERYEFTVSDHDAEDRATLERYGIKTVAAKKDVSVGIQAVQQRMKIAGDGKPRLMVMRGALVEMDKDLEEAKQPLCITDEFEMYAWPKGADGKPNKEAPVKMFDHSLDTCRYFCLALDSGSKGIYL